MAKGLAVNDREIYKFLVEAGWEEKYEREKLKKYYRFEVTTTGKHYFYLDRDDDNARICMAPQFAEHVAAFEKIPGVMPGLARKKSLLGKSSNMREFTETTGRTGDDIPQFFPITFRNYAALAEALRILHSIIDSSNQTDIETHNKSAVPEAGPASTLNKDLDAVNKLQYPIEEVQQKAIKTRRGQPEFRKRLLAAYDSQCAVSGCKVQSVLEAAHIIPHAEGTDWETSNGLPLRADIHTLFDLRLLSVGPDYRIHVSKGLVGSDYEKVHGHEISLPGRKIDYPSPDKLAKHFEGFLQRECDEYAISLDE